MPLDFAENPPNNKGVLFCSRERRAVQWADGTYQIFCVKCIDYRAEEIAGFGQKVGHLHSHYQGSSEPI